MQTSPLREVFQEAGALFETTVDCEIAIQTKGPDLEYEAIRKNIGITDRWEMAKFRISGEGALDLLVTVVAGNIENLPENTIRLSSMLSSAGKILADVQIYNNFEDYIVTCNRALKEKVDQQFHEQNIADVVITDITDSYTAICVEGPQAWRIPETLVGMDGISLRLLTFTHCEVDGIDILLSRAGFTGEYGYIFFVAPDSAVELLGRMQKAIPEAILCGRWVHDLLMLEVRSFNFSKDIVYDETPLQAGLHWMIDFQKEKFIGRDAIITEKEKGLTKKMVAFQITEGGEPIRLGGVYDADQKVGYIANCGHSPHLDCGIGLAYLDAAYAWVGIELKVETESGTRKAKTVSSPFFMTESNFVEIS